MNSCTRFRGQDHSESNFSRSEYVDPYLWHEFKVAKSLQNKSGKAFFSSSQCIFHLINIETDTDLFTKVSWNWLFCTKWTTFFYKWQKSWLFKYVSVFIQVKYTVIDRREGFTILISQNYLNTSCLWFYKKWTEADQ